MFRSYDHHQAEKYITTLGLLNWQRIHCFHKISHYNDCLYYVAYHWYSAVMGDVFSSVCTLCVPLRYGGELVNVAGLAAWVWILQLAVLLVAVLRLFRPCGVYLVLAVLCGAVSRFLVGLCVPVCLCPFLPFSIELADEYISYFHCSLHFCIIFVLFLTHYSVEFELKNMRMFQDHGICHSSLVILLLFIYFYCFPYII
jgi:hypothetical protein